MSYIRHSGDLRRWVIQGCYNLGWKNFGDKIKPKYTLIFATLTQPSLPPNFITLSHGLKHPGQSFWVKENGG